MVPGTLQPLQYKIAKCVDEDVQMLGHSQAEMKRSTALMLTSSILMLLVGWRMMKGINIILYSLFSIPFPAPPRCFSRVSRGAMGSYRLAELKCNGFL